MTLTRRGFFFGLGATIAVARSGVLMPIKQEIILPPRLIIDIETLPPGEYIAQLRTLTFLRKEFADMTFDILGQKAQENADLKVLQVMQKVRSHFRA
jgi:hypothetical protein